MSDDNENPASDDPRLGDLVREFRQLSPEDQALVMALVVRLGGSTEAGFAPDVPFMDFDE